MSDASTARRAGSKADRRRLAFDAAGEIDAICNTLLREQGNDGFEVLLPPMLRRIIDVASIVLSVEGGDDARESEEMRAVLHGTPMPELENEAEEASQADHSTTGATELALSMLEDAQDEAHALAVALAAQLRPADPKNPEDEDDLVAWRLACLLCQHLSSTVTLTSVGDLLSSRGN